MKLCLSVAVIGLLSGPAWAETLQGAGGSEFVTVWRSDADMRTGYGLLASGARTGAVQDLMSCMAPAGSKVAVTYVGLSSSSIVVIAGPKEGCRGSVLSQLVR